MQVATVATSVGVHIVDPKSFKVISETAQHNYRTVKAREILSRVHFTLMDKIKEYQNPKNNNIDIDPSITVMLNSSENIEMALDVERNLNDAGYKTNVINDVEEMEISIHVYI
jgi:hypothetical protein